MNYKPICREAVTSISRRAVALLGAVLTTSPLVACADTSTFSGTASAGKLRQATICPQCKMVAVTVPQPIARSFAYGRPFTGFGSSYGWGGLGTGFGWGAPTFGYTVYDDKCPNCQGTLNTFFTEGKWKHRCTMCEQKPFTCPVAHRT